MLIIANNLNLKKTDPIHAPALQKLLLELKEDPRAAFNALQKGFGQLITPQAVEALARQPKILFENLVEQVIQILFSPFNSNVAR